MTLHYATRMNDEAHGHAQARPGRVGPLGPYATHPTDEHNWTWTYSRELKMWLCMDKNGEAKPLAHLEDWLAHPGPAPRNPCSLTCACLTASP